MISDQDVGHIYVGSLSGGKMEQKAIFSVQMLRSNIDDKQYITAAAFYNPQWGRSKHNLRWLLALVLDFDGGPQDAQDLAIRIADAGLPPASMMVRTPRGIHVWWLLKPVRGTPKAVRLYEVLQTSLAAELGADPAAVGAERFWRLPTSQNVIYSNMKKYKLSLFRTWRDQNRPQDMPGQAQNGQVYAFTRGLLAHPAIKLIQRGVCQRMRNNACFSLAVAHLISGYSVTENEQIMLAWNQLNSPSMQVGEVIKCVKSAAKGLAKNFQHYYNAMRLKIREITGIDIKYRPITAPKIREERKRSHIHEYKHDILNLLDKRGGKMLVTQGSLAKQLNAPLRSIKLALAELEKSGIIFKNTVARGRKSFTIIIAKIYQNCKKLMVHSGIHYGGGRVSSEVSSEVSYSDSLTYLQRYESRTKLLL